MCRPSLLLSAPARPFSRPAAIMLALISRLLDWFRSLFWKEEMELTLVGLQYSGKTTFVNVIAVSAARSPAPGAAARGSGPKAGAGAPVSAMGRVGRGLGARRSCRLGGGRGLEFARVGA